MQHHSSTANATRLAFAAYCRVANDDGSGRIEAQRGNCEAYLAEHDPQEIHILPTKYEDIASGTTLERPGLQSLLADIRAGRVRGVIVHDLARLTRSLRQLVELLRHFGDNEVELRSVKEGLIFPGGIAGEHFGIPDNLAEHEKSLNAARMRDKRASGSAQMH